MINILARIDYAASAGDTAWHRASALAKLLLAALMIVLAVFTPSLRLLIGLHALAWALALTSRMPFRVVLAVVAYPALFALLFVLSTWSGSYAGPLALVLRPLTTSLTGLWLVSTTPYPDLFAPLSRLLPRAVGDALFLTYRALFDLIGRAERLWRALRVRGASSIPLRRRLPVLGEAMGTLVLHAFDGGQRLYATMRLRGHSGRICGCRHYAEVTRYDLLVAALGLVVSALAFAWWRSP